MKRKPYGRRGPYASRRPIAERFWERVDKSDEGGCWLWTGTKDRHGYGRLTVADDHATTKAHRVAWELTHGAVPAGLSVLHKCDTPACVRPSHLFVGTQTDNMKDAAQKGRLRLPKQRFGADHPNSKLTSDQAREVYQPVRAGHSKNQLSKQFGVDRNVIRNIAARRSYVAATEEVA